MKYLFFDTETTGLPDNWNAPASHHENWPHIVQLAWMVTDESGHIISTANHLVKPENYEVPPGMIHGISNERAMKEGKVLAYVLNEFRLAMNDAYHLVCHNYDFDSKIVGAAFFRKGAVRNPFDSFSAFCTMKQTTNWAKIPQKPGSRRGSYKWPKLDELHFKCFGKDFSGAHDAMADVIATKNCFFYLMRNHSNLFTHPYQCLPF